MTTIRRDNLAHNSFHRPGDGGKADRSCGTSPREAVKEGRFWVSRVRCTPQRVAGEIETIGNREEVRASTR